MGTDTADVDRRITEAREGLRNLYAERKAIRASKQKDKYDYLPELRKKALALYLEGQSFKSIAIELKRHTTTIDAYIFEEAKALAEKKFQPIPPRPAGYIGQTPEITEWCDRWFREVYQTAQQIKAEWKAINSLNKQKHRTPA